jgi:Domain of unknown function (DUF1877)
MGVRAGLTEIPPDLFEQVVAGGEPKLPDEPRHSIDKAWNDFHAVFKVRGPPLSLAIAGDRLHPLSPHNLDEFCEGNHDYYMGFMSPRLVREVADALSTLTASDYKRWESELFGNHYNCGETFFPHLKAAYVDAAGRQNALMIVIC